MTRHAITAVLASFWLGMVVLLWRAETGRDSSSSPIPLDLVVERILHASDPSQLRLLHHGRELGQLRWVASIQERAPSPGESTPEGMVRVIEGYRLDIDLNLHGETPDRRWRALAQVELGPDRIVREVLLRLVQRPRSWEARMRAGSSTVEWLEEDGRAVRRSQSIDLSDMTRLGDAIGPLAALLPLPWPPEGGRPGPGAAPWVEWSAADEPLLAGAHRVRTFRVRARILGRFDAEAHVSRAGELLRVMLPDHYVLASTALPGLEAATRPMGRPAMPPGAGGNP